MEAAGEAITFVAPEEEGDLRGIERTLGKSIPRVTLPDFDYRAPAPPKPQGQGGGRRPPQRRQGSGRPSRGYGRGPR